MCTLTWLRSSENLTIYFNRDEKRTRLPAKPPRIHEINGVRVLAPVDGDAGGTWLAVNESGLAVAILNYYEAERTMISRDTAAGRHRSRGQLVFEMVTGSRRQSIPAQLEPYRPFIMVEFHPDREPVRYCWDGVTLSRDVIGCDVSPITTSSFDTREVVKARRDEFDRLQKSAGGITGDMLHSYHLSRDARGGAYSVTMTRADAQTVSFSKVMIGNKEITFYYQPRHTAGADPDYLPGETVCMRRV